QVVLARVDPEAGEPPRRVHREVQRLGVRRWVRGLDLAERTPAHRTGGAPELLGPDRLPVVQHGVTTERHPPSVSARSMTDASPKSPAYREPVDGAAASDPDRG